MTTKAATIFLIDANRLSRDGLTRLFEGTAFSVVGEAGSLREGAMAVLASDTAPDLILIDASGGGQDEMDLLRALHAKAPQTRLVMLDGDLCGRRLSEVLGAGVDGYLLRTITSETLIQSLTLVMMGEKVFPAHLAELLLRPGREPTNITGPTAGHGLSQRELQTLSCLINGQSNKMIAINLNITEATVKVHLKSLLRKINASNRTQAAIWALNNGIGRPKASDDAADLETVAVAREPALA